MYIIKKVNSYLTLTGLGWSHTTAVKFETEGEAVAYAKAKGLDSYQYNIVKDGE